MGNLSSCFSGKEEENGRARRKAQQRRSSQAIDGRGAPGTSARWRRGDRSLRRDKLEEALVHDQALAAILLQQQHQVGSNGLLPLDRSSSLRFPAPAGGKSGLVRSSSSRARSLADPLLPPHQLVNQDLKMVDLETNYFVLIHGGGFGAWCWYKTITLLEECGFKVTAVDLTGSGVDSFDSNNITSLSQYVRPLTDFLENLGDGEKVMLVGHDFGGVCMSYAMEAFPSKIAKTVFVSAAMLTNGQSALDMFSEQASSNDLMRQAQIFLYANGSDRPPTAIDLDKSLLKDLLFNESPSKLLAKPASDQEGGKVMHQPTNLVGRGTKVPVTPVPVEVEFHEMLPVWWITSNDVALASVSMRPIPFAPVLEKLSLSDEKYGSVRRFYIETAEDNAIPLSVQQNLIKLNPPERVFWLKGSDHSPFFSKPQALHKHLVEIAKAPPPPLPAG